MSNRAFILIAGILLLFPFLHQTWAQAPPSTEGKQQESVGPEQSSEEESKPGEVIIEGRPVLTVYEAVASHTPEQRAEAIQQRIISAAQAGGLSTAHVKNRQAWTEILVGDELIMAVTQADADFIDKPRQQLANEYAEHITREIRYYREQHSWRIILHGVLNAILTTVLLVLVVWVLRRFAIALRRRIAQQIHVSGSLELKTSWHAVVTYAGPIALAVGAIFYWLLVLSLFQAYVTITLGFFSSTREVSLTTTKWVSSQLGLLLQAAMDYLPNLVVVAAIMLTTYCVLRLIRLIFDEIRKGELKIRGFFPDWAEPTEKLIRILAIIMALIVVFPYLPGAKSPAFQGISIFLGVLLSLGSSSAVANAVAGVILTYMRSFLVGDWVQIGDTTGKVIEKTLLVTRILTPKAEIMTIPNSTVMSGAVKNYSVEARKSGVILHTAVTIGYDAPWRTVHELLINAALATPYVLQHPIPFVLQESLDDFYVCYELNAYTDAPMHMLTIYSELHKHIQDKFNEAGLEICSPHFSSLRDGNVIAIPQQYIDAGYKARGFHISGTPSGDNRSADGRLGPVPKAF